MFDFYYDFSEISSYGFTWQKMVQVMAVRLTSDKASPEPMMI